MRTAAVILAAGYSSRMGRFKPLLPLGGVPAAERAVNLFRETGIKDILAVIGHRAEDLAPLFERVNVRPVFNTDFDRGMFTSVAAGVRALPAGTDAFFILPVDIPLVRPATLRMLMTTREREPERIALPCFDGAAGHPPLIPSRLVKAILDHDGRGGLRTVLQASDPVLVEVPDQGILLDMDTPDDYKTLESRADRPGIPTPAECEAVLIRLERVQDRVLRHSRAVADVAAALAEALNRAGAGLDTGLVHAGALLHDIAKGKPDHAGTGARRLVELGFQPVADIVAVHVDLPQGGVAVSGEAEVVFMADKLVQTDRIVSLEERFRRALERYAGDPDALAGAGRRLENARKIKTSLERRLGYPLETLLERLKKGRDPQ